MQELPPEPRARARDHGLARLRRATRFSIFGATALAGAFTGVVAHSNPGHKAPAAAATKRRTTETTVQRPAPLVPVQPAAAPTPPAAARGPRAPPVTTTAPPVATTGAT